MTGTDGRGREPFKIYPIRRVDVYQAVLGQLDALIGELPAGSRLPPERELVERLKVSRVSVREALRALESMGKIEIRRNQGSYVVDPRRNIIAGQLRAAVPDTDDILDHLVHVRAAIEDRVVACIGPATDLAPVKSVLEAVSVELDSEDLEPGSLDMRFEVVLGRLTGNPMLTELQRSVHELWIEAWSARGLAPGDRRQLHAEHLSIYQALQRGDITDARRLMSAHVDRPVRSV